LCPELLNHLTTICKVAGTHVRHLAMLGMGLNEAAMALVDLDKLLNEGLDRLRLGSAATGDAADTPSSERAILVVHGELAAIYNP
jgi:hypothetical protein